MHSWRKVLHTSERPRIRLPCHRLSDKTLKEKQITQKWASMRGSDSTFRAAAQALGLPSWFRGTLQHVYECFLPLTTDSYGEYRNSKKKEAPCYEADNHTRKGKVSLFLLLSSGEYMKTIRGGRRGEREIETKKIKELRRALFSPQHKLGKTSMTPSFPRSYKVGTASFFPSCGTGRGGNKRLPTQLRAHLASKGRKRNTKRKLRR